jgi:hypothetical protein
MRKIMRLKQYINEEKKAIIKATGEKVILTGRKKKRGGRQYVQVMIPWTEADDKKFKDMWNKDRPSKDKGQKTYLPIGSLKINEEYLVGKKTIYYNDNPYIEIWRNPSKKEIRKIAKHVRFIGDLKTKKVYAWNGLYLHEHVWNSILKEKLKDNREWWDDTLFKAESINGRIASGYKRDIRGKNEYRWLEKYFTNVIKYIDR